MLARAEVTFEITFEPQALNAAARFLEDDPSGLTVVLDTIDKLAEDPRPAGSGPYGSADIRRLRIGEYRVLYAVDVAVIRILVTQLGRTA